MDDCSLKSLEGKPGKLSPPFKKDITEYSLTVGSQVESVTFNYETSDRGASVSIPNSSGGKSVKLKEGELIKVKIDVTAEDGTTKTYWVQTKRLSAKDAALAAIEVKGCILDPPFSPNVTQYFSLVPCNISSVIVTPSVHDAKASVKINGGGKPGVTLQLSIGVTLVIIEVTSPNGSNSQTYNLLLIRKQFPRFVRFADPQLAVKYECPISLGALYQPIAIKGSQPVHTYSGPIIDDFTKTSKIDPIGEELLDLNWRLPNYELDKEMSQAIIFVPLANGGFSEKMKFIEIGNHVKELNQTPKSQLDKVKFDKNCPLTHSFETRNWETKLHQIFDETNAVKLDKSSDEALEKYFDCLPNVGIKTLPVYAKGQSPNDYLEQASFCLASAIKSKNKDANLHLKLGLVLEEKYYLENEIGFKKDKRHEGQAAGTDVDAQESSMAEECEAICRLKGTPKDASLAQQLKAIDLEYHSLIEQGQSGKADHVQALYAWKSKHATKSGDKGKGGGNENSPLNQAHLKYMDALSFDNSKAIHHFHVGRTLVQREEYDKAIPRLEAAIASNEQLDIARFYLGLSLALKKGGPGQRIKETIFYLLNGMEQLLKQITEEAIQPETHRSRVRKLHGENLLRQSNVYMLEGFLQLGYLLINAKESSIISSTDVFHTVALLTSFAMTTVTHSNIYQQMERILMDSHWMLLNKLLEEKDEKNAALIALRCERLSAVIKRSTLPPNAQLLQLQLKIGQMLVRTQPCNSHAIYLLGNAQLALYDFQSNSAGASELLADCRKSFFASIALEGKDSSGEPLPEITGQNWWKEKLVELGSSQAKAAQPTAAATAAAAAAAFPAKASGGVGAGTKSAPKASPQSKSNAGRGTPAAQGTPSKVAATGKAFPQNKSQPPLPPSQPPPPPQPTTAEPESEEKKISEEVKVVIINRKSFQPRLGLARALSRGTKDSVMEAKKYYLEAIDMAPNEHSAYIEVAELLTDKDPLGAVDVYSRFPVSKNATFDDAYIFGEIVRLLFKAEKYDDPRLLSNMIALGRVMGIASLEKYIEILQSKFKTDFLKQLYAGVNKKAVDDPMMIQFFKMRGWV